MAKMHPREAVEVALVEYWRAADALRDLIDPPGLISGDLNGRYRPWYIGPRDSDETWPPQRESLRARDLPQLAIESIDSSTNRILSLLPSPGENEFDARGLVLGYVQSGKTANYAALIAKASDAGYKLFVVLAGNHNTLRSQTQRVPQPGIARPSPGALAYVLRREHGLSDIWRHHSSRGSPWCWQ